MLNPSLGWKGKVKNLEKYRKEKNDRELENLKNQKNEKIIQIEKFSKEFNIPIDKIKKFLNENKK